jgi:hypothetical protein
MNEKIRELAEQAGPNTEEELNDDRTNIYVIDVEKFAQLIVRECIVRCEGNGEYRNHTNSEWGQGLAAGIELCKETIKLHFGVKL